MRSEKVVLIGALPGEQSSSICVSRGQETSRGSFIGSNNNNNETKCKAKFHTV